MDLCAVVCPFSRLFCLDCLLQLPQQIGIIFPIDSLPFLKVVNDHNALCTPEDRVHYLSRWWHHVAFFFCGLRETRWIFPLYGLPFEVADPTFTFNIRHAKSVEQNVLYSLMGNTYSISNLSLMSVIHHHVVKTINVLWVSGCGRTSTAWVFFKILPTPLEQHASAANFSQMTKLEHLPLI